MSYFGLNLLLNLAVPIALATIAQMFLLCINDLDLSIGAFVSLVACIAATWLNDTPVLGVLALAALVAAYAGMGALIEIRQLPSIVVTLGMSFVWLGLAVMVLPTPGGKAPEWVRRLMTLKPWLVPFPIIASVIIAAIVHMGLMRSSYGVVLRGAGGNPRAVERAGWSMLRVKATFRAGRALRRVLRCRAHRAHYLGRRQHRAPLHATVDRGRDPRRWRVRRREGLARRRGDRGDDADAGGVASCRSCGSTRIGRSARRADSILVLTLRVVISRAEARA